MVAHSTLLAVAACTTLLGACTAMWGVDQLTFDGSEDGAGGDSNGTGGTSTGGTGGSGNAGAGGSGDAGAEGWLDADWQRRKPIMVGPVDQPLSGFPLAVIVDGDVDLSAASGDGVDFRFTAADGVTVLPYEIERFEAAEGRLAAWVELPVLPADEPTMVYLYYDNPSAPDGQNPAGLWSAYAGIWHLSGSFVDSSGSANHGVVVGSSGEPASGPGIVGHAAYFDGVDDSILVGNPADGSLDFDVQSFSYSLWVWVQASVGTWDIPWSKGGTLPTTPGYSFQLGTNNWATRIGDGSSTAEAYFGAETDFLGGWTYLVAVVDRDDNALLTYANGVQSDAVSLANIGSLSCSLAAFIGHDTYVFQGRIDEMRVAPVALSPVWVQAVYDNASAPNAFVTWGIEQTAP